LFFATANLPTAISLGFCTELPIVTAAVWCQETLNSMGNIQYQQFAGEFEQWPLSPGLQQVPPTAMLKMAGNVSWQTSDFMRPGWHG
jgi:hypothetical protein